MRQILNYPRHFHGQLWHHRNSGLPPFSHHHSELEFCLIIRGSGTYFIGEQRHELRRHDLLWLFPGQEHVLVDQSSDFRMWIGIFSPELVRTLAITGTAAVVLGETAPSGLFHRRLVNPQAERLAILFAEIEAQIADPIHYNLGLAYALSLTWKYYQAGDTIAAGSSVHAAISQVVRVLRGDGEAATMAALAQRVGLSRGHLSQLFTREMGFSLPEYRNRLRIERFFANIAQPGTSILAAARASGFGSYPQFNRVFRQIVGSTPTAYVRKGRPSRR